MKTKALRFSDSGDVIALDTADALGLTDHDFTVECWLEVDDWVDGEDFTVLGTDQAGVNVGLHLVVRDRRIHMGFYANDTGGQTELAKGVWYHVAWRYDKAAQEQAIFINGVLDAAGTGRAPFAGRGRVHVGRWGGKHPFRGRLADLRIWSVARPGHQILHGMHRRLHGDEADLAGYWRLAEPPADGAVNARSRVAGKYLARPRRVEIDALRIDLSESMTFDGQDDYVLLERSLPVTDATHELWFRTEDADCGLFSLMEGDQTGGNDRHLHLKGGNLVARIWNGETIETRGYRLSDGRWHHVAHVFGASAGGQRLYVDGVLAARGGKAASDFNWQKACLIGYSVDSASPYFRGQIAEVRLWSRARGQAEIHRDMGLRLSGGEADLLALFPLAEQGGDVARNLVAATRGEDLHGKVRGTPIREAQDRPFDRRRAVAFNGGGSVEVEADPGVGFETYTLEGWVRPEETTAAGYPVLATRNHSVWIDGSGAVVHKFPNARQGETATPGGLVSWDRWQHLAVVREGGVVRTLLDGEQKHEGEAHGDPRARVCSIEVERDPRAEVVQLFTGVGYGGSSMSLPAGRHDINALSAGIGNDTLCSLKIAAGWRVTLYQHAGFAGASRQFTGEVADLAEFKNTASSLVVEWVGSRPGTACAADGGTGSEVALAEGRTGDEQLVMGGAGPRSLRLFPGFKARVYEYRDFGGKPRDLSASGLGEETFSLPVVLASFGGSREQVQAAGFKGLIADVRLWSAARPEAAVGETLRRQLSGDEDGLAGWWPLAESAGDRAFDHTGGRRHGRVTGGRRGGPAAPFRHAVSFDGETAGAELAVPANSRFSEDKDFTLEAWLRPAGKQRDVDHDDNSVIEKWDGSRGYPFALRYLNGSGKVWIGRYGSTRPYPNITSGRAIDDGVFHHVALVKKGDRVHLFVDGHEEGSAQDNTAGRVKNDSALYFACRGGKSNFFRGELTEVRIWDHAVEPGDLFRRMKVRLKGDESGLAGYWPLGQGSEQEPVDGRLRRAGAVTGTSLEDADLPLVSDLGAAAASSPAAVFNGRDGYVAIANSEQLRLSREVAVEAWVQPAGKGVETRPVVAHQGPGSGWSLDCSSQSTGFSVQVAAEEVRVEADLDLTAGTPAWIHLAGSYDGQDVRLCVNGVSRAVAAASGALVPCDLELDVGRSANHPDRFFAGRITEVRVWGKGRSLGEIHADLFQRLATAKGEFRRLVDQDGKLPGLVGYWRLSAETADRSGYGHSGVAHNVTFEATDLPPRLAAAALRKVAAGEQLELLRGQLAQTSEKLAAAEKEKKSFEEQVRVLEKKLLEHQKKAREDAVAAAERHRQELERERGKIAAVEAQQRQQMTGEFALEDVYVRSMEQVEKAREKIEAEGGAYRLGKVSMDLKFIALDGGASASFPGVDKDVASERFTTQRLEFTPRKGVEPVQLLAQPVPDLADYTETLARRKLNEAGFLAEVHYQAVVVEADAPDPTGRVVNQVPTAGTAAPPNSTVMIFIGKAS